MVVKFVSRPPSDGVLRLPLGADEQHRASGGGELADELLGLPEQLGGLAQVDDVDAVPLAEDERLHLRVPALRLMAEMNAGLQQVLHSDRGQASSNVFLFSAC
jgi:hypothetical protein